MKKCNSMASVCKMVEQLNSLPPVVVVGDDVDGVTVGDATLAAPHVVAKIGVVALVNEEPHFDIDEELRDHLMPEEQHFDDDDDDIMLIEPRAPSFKETYVSTVRPVIARVDALIARFVWSERQVVTHPPASDADVEALLRVIRKISPLIGDHLKIDSSNIKKHPLLQKVIHNHSRGSPYFRQFFKQPLVTTCDCVACTYGMLIVLLQLWMLLLHWCCLL